MHDLDALDPHDRVYAAIFKQAIKDARGTGKHAEEARQFLGEMAAAALPVSPNDNQLNHQEDTTMELTIDEQKRVKRPAELEAARKAGAYIPDAELQRARDIAELTERNAATRAALHAQLAAEEAAKVARLQAEQQARVEAAKQAYRRQARALFVGTDAEFDAAWPSLLADWQRRAVVDGEDTRLAEKRREIGRYF